MDGGEQRDGQHDDGVGVLEGVAGLDHGDTDGRMGDRVELEPRGLVREGDGRQRLAVDGPVRRHDAGAEAVDQRLVGGATRRHHVASDLVRVDQQGAPLDEKVGDGRLPRADPSGQADGEHASPVNPAFPLATGSSS
jgi:hypothetical protein